MRRMFLGLVCSMLAYCSYAQIISGSFVHAGYVRAYDLHLPPSWTPGSSLPLVIDLHYLGANGRDQDSLSQFNPIADAEGFVVCHPSGLGTNWNVGQYVPYTSGEDDAGFINALIDTMHTAYNIDYNRVYLVGMGQGGFMVHRLTCELGYRIAAVAVVGGSIADSAAYYCGLSQMRPMMLIHGTADSVVPYFTGLPGVWPSVPDLLSFWQNRLGCSFAPVTTNLPDLVQEGSTITSERWTCNQNLQLLHYKVNNGGFAWPGATRDLGSGGNRNMDINASQHIWDFFKGWDAFGPVAVDPQADLPSASIKIYPQPAGDVLHVTMENTGPKHLKMMNLQGVALNVPVRKISDREFELAVQELPAGIYLLQVGESLRRIALMR